jgi:hypothetical protein
MSNPFTDVDPGDPEFTGAQTLISTATRAPPISDPRFDLWETRK